MSNTPCACAALFQIGDDYTLEHHPDCHSAMSVPDDLVENARRFGELATEAYQSIKDGIEYLANQYKETCTQITPLSPISASVNCHACGLHFTFTQEHPIGQRWFASECPGCAGKMIHFFDEEGYQQFLESQNQRLPPPPRPGVAP